MAAEFKALKQYEVHKDDLDNLGLGELLLKVYFKEDENIFMVSMPKSFERNITEEAADALIAVVTHAVNQNRAKLVQ